MFNVLVSDGGGGGPPPPISLKKKNYRLKKKIMIQIENVRLWTMDFKLCILGCNQISKAKPKPIMC
jgi:hypothetical protein